MIKCKQTCPLLDLKFEQPYCVPCHVCGDVATKLGGPYAGTDGAQRCVYIHGEVKMVTFKKGDRIRCISVDAINDAINDGYQIGEIYTVSKLSNAGKGSSPLVYCKEIPDVSGMFADRFELVKENKFMSMLVNSQPMKTLVCDNRKVLVLFNDGSMGIHRANSIIMTGVEWAEIIKVDPKPDANGWFKMGEVQPTAGDVVQLCVRNNKYQSKHELRTIVWEKYPNPTYNWTHWRIFKGPVNE